MRKILSLIIILLCNISHAQERDPILEFSCLDSTGKNISISDFKGQVVYLDVWASWCLPCRRQIPKLKELKEAYKNEKDLVFMYVSLDVAEEKWKKFVTKKEVKGVHLIANSFFDHEFSDKYGIVGIPHFILIDKAGYVYKNDAPRPGWPELRDDLDLLLAE